MACAPRTDLKGGNGRPACMHAPPTGRPTITNFPLVNMRARTWPSGHRERAGQVDGFHWPVCNLSCTAWITLFSQKKKLGKANTADVRVRAITTRGEIEPGKLGVSLSGCVKGSCLPRDKNKTESEVGERDMHEFRIGIAKSQSIGTCLTLIRYYIHDILREDPCKILFLKILFFLYVLSFA